MQHFKLEEWREKYIFNFKQVSFPSILKQCNILHTSLYIDSYFSLCRYYNIKFDDTHKNQRKKVILILTIKSYMLYNIKYMKFLSVDIIY